MGRHRHETHNAIRVARFAVAAGLLAVSWIAVQNRDSQLETLEQPLEAALPVSAPQVMALAPVELNVPAPPSRPSVVNKTTAPTPSLPPQAPAVVVERPTVRTTTKATTKPTPKPTTPRPQPRVVVKTAPAPVVKPKPIPAPVKVAPTPVAPVAGHAGLIPLAKTYIGIGIRYVFGGKVAPTLDCSGFVWTVLKKAGYNVPYRNSSALKAWATPISKSQAQPGDLVFWPGHVGFYAGPGIVVDNGTSAGPKVTPIWGSPTYGRIPI